MGVLCAVWVGGCDVGVWGWEGVMWWCNEQKLP